MAAGVSIPAAYNFFENLLVNLPRLTGVWLTPAATRRPKHGVRGGCRVTKSPHVQHPPRNAGRRHMYLKLAPIHAWRNT